MMSQTQGEADSMDGEFELKQELDEDQSSPMVSVKEEDGCNTAKKAIKRPRKATESFVEVPRNADENTKLILFHIGNKS